MFSKIALKLYCLVKNGTISSNAKFWRDFSCKEKIENIEIDTAVSENYLKTQNIGLICVFDEGFIEFSENILPSEKPFLFAYKGKEHLIKEVSQNIAVIGTLEPTEEIIEREEKIVQKLIRKNLNIVSGLAKGCDTVAHKTCLKNEGKTIAILPSMLENIFPKDNHELANEIIQNGGLLLTEYINEPKNHYERIKRFIERDRLQAMLSKAVILIASFKQGDGDSGSRHCYQKAKEYSKQRFVMFNAKTDTNKKIFGLNQNLIKSGEKILTQGSINEL